MTDSKQNHYKNNDIEEYLTESKKWIGKETGIVWGRYPVEYEPIRRWCRMVDFSNPLYMDEEYARKTRWGGCLCPPFMIPFFSGAADGADSDWPNPAPAKDNLLPPLPGNKTIGTGSEFRFFRPVRVGERLGAKRRLVDVFVKPTHLDSQTFWVVRDTMYFNENKETVAVRRSQSIRFKEQETPKKKHPETSATHRVISEAYPANKLPSFNHKLRYEDIEEGKEIQGYSLHLDRLRFYLQSSGSQIFGPFHTDEEFVKKQGLSTIFADANFTQAAFNRLLSEWAGNNSWLARLSIEMKKPNFLGENILVMGKVIKKYLIKDEGYVDCDLWIENNREGKATWSTATIQLPLRDSL